MMKRIYSCMNGHQPRIEVEKNTGKVMLVCPPCDAVTHQHKDTKDAIAEWNYSGSRMWRDYDVRWWHTLLRWWRGSFYGE